MVDMAKDRIRHFTYLRKREQNETLFLYSQHWRKSKNVQARAVQPAKNHFEYPWVTQDIDSVYIEILV